MALFTSELWRDIAQCGMRDFYEKLLLLSRSVEHLKRMHADPDFVPADCRLLPPDFKQLQADWRWMNKGVAAKGRPTYKDQVAQALLDRNRKTLRGYYGKRVERNELRLPSLSRERGRYVISDRCSPDYEDDRRMSFFSILLSGVKFDLRCFLAGGRQLIVDLKYPQFSGGGIDEPVARLLIQTVPVRFSAGIGTSSHPRFSYMFPAGDIWDHLEFFDSVEERFRPKFVHATFGEFESALLKLLQDEGIPATELEARPVFFVQPEGPIQQQPDPDEEDDNGEEE